MMTLVPRLGPTLLGNCYDHHRYTLSSGGVFSLSFALPSYAVFHLVDPS